MKTRFKAHHNDSKDYDQKFRVLHVSTPMTWRGGERQVHALFLNLHREGIMNYILCPKGSALAGKFKRAPYIYRKKKSQGGIDLRYAWHIMKICKKNEIEIIHVHDSHAHTAAILAVDIWRCKAKIVVSRRVDFPIGRSLLSRYKYNHKRVAKILCVSNKIKEVISPRIKKEHIGIHTVYSGIRLGDYEDFGFCQLRLEHAVPDEVPIIINIAALADHKDHFTFLDTIRIIKDQDIEFYSIIVGDGPLSEQLKAYAKKLGLGKRDVVFTGFMHDVITMLHQVSIFLFTSKEEGLGTSILDAFGCKVPVVATNAGGIPELVKHNETGYLADVKDPVGLAKGILKILDDEEYGRKLADNAYEYLKGFTHQETMLKTLGYYREVVGIKV